MEDIKTNIETLLKKAATSGDSGDAMRFTQAALNAANAACALNTALRAVKEN